MPDPNRPHGEREDDTVQTILERARQRARTVSQRCTRSVRPGERRPTPGAIERVDPKRLAHIGSAPRDVEREDAFEQGLAAATKGR